MKTIFVNIFLLFVAFASFAGPQTIDGTEKLNPGAATLLFEEQVLHNKDLWRKNAFATNMDPAYIPEARPKFPLPYYLVPTSIANFKQAPSLSPQVREQILTQENGKTFYKLFVHPESEAHYKFLKPYATYVDANHTEFIASPTSSYRSLMVWNEKSQASPFIAKVSLDRNVIGSIDRLVSQNEVDRSLQNQLAFDLIGRDKLQELGLKIYPETAGLTLKVKGLLNPPAKLGGQLIREIPAEVLSGESRILNFSAIMSNHRETRLFVDMVKASGLSAENFIRQILIHDYMDMFEHITFEQGLNFEPHSQNLSLETTQDFKTRHWVLKDFGGVWPDFYTMAKNDGPASAYVSDHSAEVNKMEGGRVNAINSYVFFYRRQVFEMLLVEMQKAFPELTESKTKSLKSELDKRFFDLLRKHYHLNLRSLTMENYERARQRLSKNTVFEDSRGKFQEIPLTASMEEWIEMKYENREWVELRDLPESGDKLFASKDGVFLISEDGFVKGFGPFSPEDLKKTDFLFVRAKLSPREPSPAACRKVFGF